MIFIRQISKKKTDVNHSIWNPYLRVKKKTKYTNFSCYETVCRVSRASWVEKILLKMQNIQWNRCRESILTQHISVTVKKIQNPIVIHSRDTIGKISKQSTAFINCNILYQLLSSLIFVHDLFDLFYSPHTKFILNHALTVCVHYSL